MAARQRKWKCCQCDTVVTFDDLKNKKGGIINKKVYCDTHFKEMVRAVMKKTQAEHVARSVEKITKARKRTAAPAEPPEKKPPREEPAGAEEKEEAALELVEEEEEETRPEAAEEVIEAEVAVEEVPSPADRKILLRKKIVVGLLVCIIFLLCVIIFLLLREGEETERQGEAVKVAAAGSEEAGKKEGEEEGTGTAETASGPEKPAEKPGEKEREQPGKEEPAPEEGEKEKPAEAGEEEAVEKKFAALAAEARQYFDGTVAGFLKGRRIVEEKMAGDPDFKGKYAERARALLAEAEQALDAKIGAAFAEVEKKVEKCREKQDQIGALEAARTFPAEFRKVEKWRKRYAALLTSINEMAEGTVKRVISYARDEAAKGNLDDALAVLEESKKELRGKVEDAFIKRIDEVIAELRQKK